MTEQPTITLMYSCKLCGAVKRRLVVPARGDEGVRAWMDQTIRAIAADHITRAPLCPAETISETWIPMTGADRIGGPSLA